MSATDVTPALTVRGPSDLICAMPYLLGFHPRRSLVIVGLDRGCVVVTARVDLEGLPGSGDIERSVEAVRRGGASDFVGIVVDADVQPRPAGCALPWADVAAEFAGAVEQRRAVVGDVLLVAQGRYWSYVCWGADCCPADGTSLPATDSEIAAAATYAGLVALPDRDDLQRLIEPVPDSDRRGLLPAIEVAIDEAVRALVTDAKASRDRRDIRSLFAAARAAEREPSARQSDTATLARWAVALRRIDVRDAVWKAVDDGRLRGDILWRYLARVLPEPYDAAPLFLTGWAAWRNGSGALARIAADRALESDPGYTAADLLVSALSNAVDPRSMPKLRRPGRRCDR